MRMLLDTDIMLDLVLERTPFVADFEDAVQLAAALASGLDAIVTRNITHYSGAPLPVYRPDEFLKLIPQP